MLFLWTCLDITSYLQASIKASDFPLSIRISDLGHNLKFLPLSPPFERLKIILQEIN